MDGACLCVQQSEVFYLGHQVAARAGGPFTEFPNGQHRPVSNLKGVVGPPLAHSLSLSA